LEVAAQFFNTRHFLFIQETSKPVRRSYQRIQVIAGYLDNHRLRQWRAALLLVHSHLCTRVLAYHGTYSIEVLLRGYAITLAKLNESNSDLAFIREITYLVGSGVYRTYGHIGYH
jgi:hypothetical protein